MFPNFWQKECGREGVRFDVTHGACQGGVPDRYSDVQVYAVLSILFQYVLPTFVQQSFLNFLQNFSCVIPFT